MQNEIQIDLSILPREAREELIRFYVSLVEKYTDKRLTTDIVTIQPAEILSSDNPGQFRKQLASLWLNLPDDQLEKAYLGDMGKAHQAILASGILYQPLSDDEKRFVRELFS
jgi:hypothetical protein